MRVLKSGESDRFRRSPRPIFWSHSIHYEFRLWEKGGEFPIEGLSLANSFIYTFVFSQACETVILYFKYKTINMWFPDPSLNENWVWR